VLAFAVLPYSGYRTLSQPQRSHDERQRCRKVNAVSTTPFISAVFSQAVPQLVGESIAS
jgi:hypothetical protein